MPAPHAVTPSTLQQVFLLGHVIEAVVLGSFVGWQREHVGREAGVRTFAAVTAGACLFGLISNLDPQGSRITGQVVTGIGFLGAGVILKESGHVVGLTTAATLWASAAIGLAVAQDLHVLAILVTALMFVLLAIPVKRWESRSGIQRQDSE